MSFMSDTGRNTYKTGRGGWRRDLMPRLAWSLLFAYEEDDLLNSLLFGKKKELEEGRSYILKEKKPEKALASFHHAIEQGLRPIYITRQHPNHVMRVYKGRETRVVWLSTTLGKDYVDPHNLNSLSNMLSNFMADGGRAVILLDGLEYLMINNDFPRILHFLEYVNEQIAIHKSILLLSLDERAFDEKELALLERNTVTLD
jgi:hypothetical protein